jgi:hypothetical protein
MVLLKQDFLRSLAVSQLLVAKGSLRTLSPPVDLAVLDDRKRFVASTCNPVDLKFGLELFNEDR